ATLLRDKYFIAALTSVMTPGDAPNEERAIVYFYTDQNRIIELISFFINREITQYSKTHKKLLRASSSSDAKSSRHKKRRKTIVKAKDVFQKNSVAAALFSCYVRVVGVHYVFSILGRPIQELDYQNRKKNKKE